MIRTEWLMKNSTFMRGGRQQNRFLFRLSSEWRWILFYFFMFTSATGTVAARNTCVLCPVITLIIPTMGYYTRRGREIRSNLTCREIQLEPKTNRGGGAIHCKIQSVERNSCDCPLRCAACRYERRRGCTLAWEVASFILF